MKNQWIYLFCLLFVSAEFLAQTNPHELLTEVYAFEKQGRFSEAVDTLQSLIDSKQLDITDLGPAWNLLGIEFLHLNKLDQSRKALEQSIQIFASHPEKPGDYAAALDNLGAVYREMGQRQISAQLRLKSLHLYEQNGNEEGVAKVCNNLAGIALEQNHRSEAKKHLQCVEKAVKLSHHLDLDDLAAMSAMQGKLAFMEGDFSSALIDFQRALNLWLSVHGEHHTLTAWGYLLRGGVYVKTGKIAQALEDIRRGLSIIKLILGSDHPQYLTAELEYAEALDADGDHSAADAIKVQAKGALQDYQRSQCFGCTVSAAAFR